MTETKISKSQKKNISIFYDFKSFKGFTFENNINIINKLYLGLGIDINKNQFIYINEKDGKTYIAANRLKIIKKNKNIKEINYPCTFLELVYHFENNLFYINEKNKLTIFKLEENKINEYYFSKENPNKDKNNHQIICEPKTTEIMNDDSIKEKIDKLNVIPENNIRAKYILLCDILSNNLKIKFAKNTPKELNKKFSLKDIEDIESVEIEYVEYELDSSGKIREDIKLESGEIKFNEGINKLRQSIKDKKKENNVDKKELNPIIIFKNFSEEKISKNKNIIFEVKSGFDITKLTEQINERINLVNNCFFEEDQKPEYFIGIVNFCSENESKLEEIINTNDDFKGNVAIFAAIDYNYSGVDLSYDISTEYIFQKNFEKINTRLDNIEKTLNEINNNTDTKLANLKTEINNNTDTKLANLKDEINNNMDTKLANLKDEINNNTDTKLANLKDEINNNTDTKLANLKNEINNNTDTKLANLKNEINNNIDNKLSNLKNEINDNINNNFNGLMTAISSKIMSAINKNNDSLINLIKTLHPDTKLDIQDNRNSNIADNDNTDKKNNIETTA